MERGARTGGVALYISGGGREGTACRPRRASAITALLTLFANAFLSATIIPAPSEPLLAFLVAQAEHGVGLLVAVATAGNTIGAIVSYAMGRYLLRYRDRSWFPASPEQLEAARLRFRRYGLVALLFSWIPAIGDALVVAAGLLRVPLPLFLLVVGIGKGLRYLVVAGAADVLFGLDGMFVR